MILRGKWGRHHYLQELLCTWQECKNLFNLSKRLMLVRNAGYRNETNLLWTEKTAPELFRCVFLELRTCRLGPGSEGDVF